MRYDCLVIGGGISGMTTALIMAKQGHHTALLEASHSTAPTIRGFTRNGLFFDTGFHYTGGLNKGEPLDIFFRYLGLSGKIEKYPFDENGFDMFRCIEPLFEFSFPFGYERIQEKLSERFPDDQAAIEKYLRSVKTIYRAQPYINLDTDLNAMGLPMLHDVSLKKFLDGITDNEMLKCILSMHCLLYGVFPGEAPLSNHAFVAGSYYESVNGIKGGGLSLSEAFDARLNELGVDVYCNSKAKEILLSQDNSVCGVIYNDNDALYCETCISTIHPQQLLGLLPRSAFRPFHRKRIELLEDTCSATIVYAKSALPIKTLARTNLFLFPTANFPDSGGIGPVEKKPMFIARTLQDGAGAHEDTCFIISPSPHAQTKYWSSSFPEGNAHAYKAYKSEISKKILTHLEASCPEFMGRISPVECATPQTLKSFTNSPAGSLYGVKHKVDQYNPMSTTRIKGLFLAGQAITAPGILGAAVSAFLACGNIIGHEKLREELRACV